MSAYTRFLRALRSRVLTAMALILIAFSSGPASAIDFYWDADADDTGNHVDGTNLGGTGTWDTSTLNWWDGSSLVAWPNLSTSNAIFSYAFPDTPLPYAIPTPFDVTVDGGGVTANRLTFQRSGYTLSGGTITLAGTDAGLHANLGETAILSSILAGSVGLTKTGGGAVRLSNSGNTYTGTTTIANGLLIISDPGALGASGSAVNITESNGTPSNTATLSFPGGTLLLDGTGGGINFSRDINVQGQGANSRGGAIVSVGNNTLSGVVSAAPGALSPTSFRSTRINSVNGTLNLTGTLNVGGTLATTITTLGGLNATGVGNFDLTGILSGTGTLEKTGGGTLFFNPSDTSGFAGALRMNASAASGGGSVRITTPNLVLGTNTGTGASSVIDLNTGFLEVRMNTASLLSGATPVAANVYSRNSTNSNLFYDHAIGSSTVNQTLTLGNFGFVANAATTFISRNGGNITFGAAPVVTGDNSATITNSLAGTLTFTGNFWSNSNTAAARTMTIAGNGNTVINGNIIAAGGASFDHVITKSGSGSLTITGTGTTLDGNLNVQAGAVRVTDFRSLNMHAAGSNTGVINLGTAAAATVGTLIIGTNVTPTAAGLTTGKTINLIGTTGNRGIYANQPGSNPVILNGAITTTEANAKGLILGGSNTADNIINGAIGGGTGSIGALTKLGAGTWVLAGASTHTGATTIQNGTLKIRANAGASDMIGEVAGNTVVFSADGTTLSAGGTLEFTGFLNTATTETLGALTPTAGAAKIAVSANGSGTADLTFTSLGARGTGAYVDYRPGASATISFTTLPAVTNGILGAASTSAFQTYNGVDWATLSGSQVVPFSTYTALPGSFSGTGGAAVNYSMSANSATTGTASVNTIKFVGGGTNPTLTLGGVLTLTGRAILFDNSAGVATITGSQLGANATEVHIITNGSSGANGGAAGVALTLGNALTVNSLIGGTTGSFTKSGTGTLIVGGNNAFTGVININEGIVQLSGATATLGVNSTAANTITVRQGATLDINAAGVSQTINTGALAGAGVITNSGGGSNTAGTISFGRSTSTGTTIFSGVLQDGDGVLNVTIDGTTARTQALIGENTYSGITTIATGAQLTVDVLANGGFNSGIGASTSAAGNLVFDGAAPTLIYRGNIRDGSLNLGSASATTDRLFTISGSGAVLSSTVSVGNAIVWSNFGEIAHGTNANRTLTLTGTSTGDNTFNPLLSNSTGFVTSLTKQGAGQWNLGNSANTYTGATRVENGILALNHNGAVHEDSPIVFAPTAAVTTQAILQMSGTFDRALSATPTAGTGSITWTGDLAGVTTGGAGFAAHTTELIVAIGGIGSPTALTWGSGGFVGTDGVNPQNLLLGSTTALSSVDFRNAINFGTAQRTVNVLDNTNTGADFAILSGVLSGTGGGLRKIGTGILKVTGANTYTGVTDLNVGTLVVSSLGSSTGPATSSLGASGVPMDNANALTIGNGTTGAAILVYSGAGEVSDRKIRLNSTGTNQIHADGSGALILTNVANDLVAGSKVLSLRGSNMQGNMITSVLADNGGTLGITADSAATWILTGENTGMSGTITVSQGALGVGHNSAFGTGTIVNSNGVIFAYGADRTLTNAVTLSNNATNGWFGDYSLIFNGANSLGINNATQNTTTNNNIVAGKALVFNGLTADLLPNNTRTWTIDGAGETVINGNFTSSTANGVQITKNGNGILTLGTSGATSNWNQNGRIIDLDRGTLRFTVNEAIPSTATSGGLTISPEIDTSDTATVDLNGTTQTINALTAGVAATGTVLIDNTSASAATFRFGANNSAVDFGSGTGSYTITDSGAGALSIVKLGNTAATFNSGITLTYQGATRVEGGSLTIASPLNGTTALQVINSGSTLALTGGLTTPSAITSVIVENGGTLNLLDGAGSQMTNLTNLQLGSSGGSMTTLGLNVGDLTTAGDNLNTDLLSLLTGGTLSLFTGNQITLNLTDAGLNANQTYNLINVVDGGLTLGALGLGDWILGATPGGFSSVTLNKTDNLISLTTGNLITGSSYWNGTSNTTWNVGASNWSTDKAGTTAAASIPGQGTDVIFQSDAATSGAVATTLEQNFKINSLTFESGTGTPTSVSIAPGAVSTNRLEVAPQTSTDGIAITTGGPAAVTISAPLKTGKDQTWTVADAGSVLTLSGGLQGEADVIKAGNGKVILSAAADPTFNGGQTADFTINAGNLEVTALGALGTLANSNLAKVVISGGGFYFNGAASTTPNPITLGGGTLSAGTATQTYSGTINVSSASFINMADSNGANTATARSITLSGVVSGSGSLTIDGNNTASSGNQVGGTLTLNNAGNTWTGGVVFNRGTMTLTAAASPAFTTNNITFNSFGRIILQNTNGTSLTRTGTLNYAAGAIGEFQADNTSGTLSAFYDVDQSGAITLGSGGTGATARVFLADDFSRVTFSGGVTLGGNSSISAAGAAGRLLAITGVINDGGNNYSLAINDDAGGWAATNGIVRITGDNTYTGGTSLSEGQLSFGHKNAIGTGTLTIAGTSTLSASTALTGANAVANAISQNASYTFVGANNLELSGAVNMGAAARTITVNGDTGATLTLSGAISNLATADGSALTLAGNATGTGVISGGIAMTGDAADLTVSGGTWTHQTGTSRIGDDLTVTGASAVLNLSSGLFQVRDDITVTTNGTLNLNATGVLSFNTATLSADASLRAVAGGTININANNAVVVTEFDGLRIGTDATGVGNLVMNANQQVNEFILGNRNADRSGNVTGTGTLTVTGNFDVYQGSIAANLASTGATAFEKISQSTVTLSGDNSGLASTGASIVYEGSLILDYTNSTATKLRAASALEMRGSNLVLNGNATNAVSQSVGSFTLANGFGSSRITLNTAGSQDLLLNLGAITRAVNARAGTLRLVLPDGAQSATNGITTSTGLTNGILGTGAYATVEDGTGTWFATKSGTNIVALASTAKNDVSTWLAGDHITDETTGFTGTYSSVGINSLRFDAAGGSSVNLGAGGVLGIATGGILVTDNVGGTPGILGGTIFSGAQASNVPELILTHDGSTTFELGAAFRTNSAFTKSGTGTVLFSGNNTSTGDVTVHNGVLQLSGGNAIGDTARVTLATHRNTTLQLLADETIGRLEGGQRQTNGDWGVVNVGANTLTINQTANSTYSGGFTGSGTIVLNAAVTATNTNNLTTNGLTTGFTGTVIVNGGLFQLSGAGTNSAPTFTVNNLGGLLIDKNGTTTSGDQIANSAAINLNSAIGNQAVAGGLWIRRDQGSTQSETVGIVTAASGTSYVRAETTAANAVTVLSVSNFERANNATLVVRGNAMDATSGRRAHVRIIAANEAAFISSMIGGAGAAGTATTSIVPWAISEDVGTAAVAAGNMGNSLTTYSTTTGFRPLNLSTEYATYATAGATNNTRESRTTDLTGLPGRTLNSLVIDNNNTATINITGSGVGQTLTNTSGAFLFTISNGAASTAYSTVLGGFDSGIEVGGSEYIFHVVNPSYAATTSTLTATIGSLLTSAADITKSGRGTLILNQANTAGGGSNKTTLNEGVLEITDLDNIGGSTGDLVFAGGTLRLGTGFADDLTDRTISFLPGGGTLDTNGIDITFANSLGSGTGGFTKTGAGNLTLNGTATYTGNSVLSLGTVTVGANNALGNGGNLSLAAGTTLALGTNSLTHGLVSTAGAGTTITGSGTITASRGFFFSNTDATQVDAVLAGSGGLFKNQNNVLTLTGLNTYTGTTEVQNGTLSLASIGNVGGGASSIGTPATVEDGIIRMGLTTAATTLQYTGTGHTSDRLIGMQGTTGGVTLDADGTGALVLGGVRTENAGAKTLTLRGSSAAGLENSTGQIREVGAVLSVFKTDANTWAYNQSQSYTGTTTVDDGILRLNAAQTLTGALQFGSTNSITTTGTVEAKENAAFGSLLVQPNGAANLAIDPTKVVTINGNVVIGSAAATSVTNFTASGGGDFVVNNTTNTGNTFLVGGTGTTNTTLADFSGLASMNVSLNTTGGTFLVSSSSGTNSTGKAELRLADTTVITANALTVGGGGTYNGNANQVNQLKLGTVANVLNVNAINIGTGSRDLGSITFQDVSGTVTVRAADGTSAAAFNMGTGTANTSAALAGNQNIFDVTGHNADLKFSTVNIGTQNRNADLVNVFSFDTGTLEIGTLTASTKGANGNTTTTTINIGGGTVTTGAWTLATTTGNGNAVATANLTGGNITFSGAINRGTDSAGGGTATGTVNLNGATLDMGGNNIGSATNQIVFNAQSGTLQNLGELNGGGDLVKTTAGTLVLAGDNNYTGRTVVSAGVLSVSSEDNFGDNPVAFNAAQLEIDGGTLLTTASFTIDDTNRGITIGASGGTIETTAATALTVASTNPIVLTGNLTKTGDGALYINSTTSGTGTVNITDGTLGGTGTISGNTTIGDGAILTGGTDGTVGTITFSGSLVNDTGATWLIDLVSDVNGSSDLVSLGIGSLDLNNATLNLVTSGLFTVGHTYTIASYGSLMSGSTFNGLGEGSVISGYQISYGASAITLTAVPEPGTLGLLGLALGGFFFRRLRKRRSDVTDEA